MREVGAVIGLDGEVIYWHLPEDRTAVSLEDSRTLWDVLWDNRACIAGFAHSHPGSGVPGASYIDVSTFAAIERGLGRQLSWWITSSDCTVALQWAGLSIPGGDAHDRHRYTSMPLRLDEEPPWVAELRRLSGLAT